MSLFKSTLEARILINSSSKRNQRVRTVSKETTSIPKMASHITLKGCLVLCVVVACWCNVWMVSCKEIVVGGDVGWTVPKDQDFFDDWASRNRFLVNDTLRFEYKTDSVIEVNEEDYNKCKAMRPLFFSNNGDTVFTFDRPGLFFFISGVSGHCGRGQKIVVKVLDSHSPPPQHQNDDQHSGAAVIAPLAKTTSVLLVVSSFFLLLFAA